MVKLSTKHCHLATCALVTVLQDCVALLKFYFTQLLLLWMNLYGKLIRRLVTKKLKQVLSLSVNPQKAHGQGGRLGNQHPLRLHSCLHKQIMKPNKQV